MPSLLRRGAARAAPHAALLVLLIAGLTRAQAPPAAVSVKLGADGRLVYASDTRGNTVIDFSHAGYGGGGQVIPDVPVRIVVSAEGGEHRRRIQAALDLVSVMPEDAQGFRGTVLLRPGTYNIEASLRITASGVVLRGSGRGEDGTVLVATGTTRRSLIEVIGRGERREIPGSRRAVADAFVPVGSRSLTLDHTNGLSVGATVIVQRPSTKAWIALLGMDGFPGWRPETRLHWQPGSRDITWDRVVTAIEGNRVTLDAPLTTALDREYGGGSVYHYDFPGRLTHVGIEKLRAVSAYDPARPGDEDHAWFFASLDKLANGWVRQVTAAHFVSYVINAEADTKWLTIEDVEALDPVSEVGGFRRRVFYTAGQLTLFQRCRSRRGQHDFVTGFTAAGPNVFLDSRADESLDYSGPLESWASGVLYDNVTIRGNAIRLVNRDVEDQGMGWAAANSVLWNCEATDVEVHSPPSAYNQAYGCKGVVTGDGIVYDPRTMPYRDFYRGMPVEPRSLYLAQLAERLGVDAVERIRPGSIPTTSDAGRPLSEADLAAFVARETAPRGPTASQRLSVEDGHFTLGGARAWTTTTYSWFQAQMPSGLARSFGPAITRFAPGRTGTGLTDDLEQMVTGMAPGSVFIQHYGLWYDRRRVNHNYDGSPERRTGDVWAPFMELPWARSGVGKAWDGLSRYDLTRFNPWYFERVKTFADLCDREGRILYYAFYFQHWLLESRSHYVDFPWRRVNAVQDTGLPDEVPAANVFYDLTHPVRRDLHRLYIRQVLDTLGGNTNVVFGIDREYTGSLAFVQFWLDTIAEWQREHGKTVFIALEIPKAQMDAVLDDPVRRPLIAAIDFHGWTYRADGRLFAIRGDLDQSPREQRPDIATKAELEGLQRQLGAARLDQGDFLNGPEYQKLFDTLWASSKPMLYRAWREYRDRYPDLVILQERDEYPALTRAIEQTIPRGVREQTAPAPLVRNHADAAWCMARPGETYLVYTMTGDAIELDLSTDEHEYTLSWIDSSTGSARKDPARVRGGRLVTLAPPAANTSRAWVAWLVR
jgi:hypothetical protein